MAGLSATPAEAPAAPPPRRLPRNWRRRVLAATVLLCGLIAGVGYPLEAWLHGRDAAALHARLGAEHVSLDETGLAQLVAGIDRPDLAIAFDDLPDADRGQAGRDLAHALGLYPAGFLHKLLDRIILAGNIHAWSGQEVGGFYFGRGFAVNCRGMNDGYIVRDIHHELSSLVRRAALPADAEWMAANPPSFSYLSYDAFRAMMADGSGDATGPDWYAKGFVRAYGTTTPDNDFNTVAERMFADGHAFAVLIKDYPRLREKARLVIKSYLAVDPAMQGYFNGTGLAEAASRTAGGT